MKFCSLILAAAAAVSAAIVPPAGLQPRQMSFCGTVASRCTGASRQAQLTTYCSSYLGIPRITSTRTVTAATVRPTTTVTVRVAGVTTITTTISVTRTLSQTSRTNVAIAAATVTTTQTTTSSSTRTTTVTRTATTRTTSVQAPDVTQMVSKCAAPPNPDAAITIMRVGGPSKKEKREADGDDVVLAKELMERQAIAKPACLASYTSAYRQSSACSCASISASTRTSTRFLTVTSTNTATTTLTTSTNTIRATVTSTVATVTQIVAETVNVQSTFTSTMTNTMTRFISGPTVTVTNNVVFTRTLAPKSTIYTLGGPAALPTFYIQNDQLNYAFLQAPSGDQKKNKNKNKKRRRSSSEIQKRDSSAGTIAFDSIPASSAQLFSLPAGGSSMSGALASSDGNLLAAESIDTISPDGEGYDNIDVQMVSASDLASGAFGPVNCSVTAGPNGTCPMNCWFTAGGPGQGDINQGNPFGTWMLGQPGASGDAETWGIWAVTP